jgi:hypothetical protein
MFSRRPCDGGIDPRIHCSWHPSYQPLLAIAYNRTHTVLGADDLLGNKRPSTSSSKTSSKKPCADAKISSSAYTQESGAPSFIPPDDQAHAELSLENSTLEDFDDNSLLPWPDDF